MTSPSTPMSSKRPWQDRLGMSLGDFLILRSIEHACGWGIMLALAFFAWLLFKSHDGTSPGLLVELFFCLMVVLIVSAFCLSVGGIIVIPILLLLSLVTVLLEAWWRIRYDLPYIPPEPEPQDMIDTRYDYQPPPYRRQKRRSWLVPLAIGLLVGYSWGDDD